MLNLVLLRRPTCLVDTDAGDNFGRGPSIDCSTKIWLQLAQYFQTRRFSKEFPVGSFYKLSLAVPAILVCGRGRQTQFCSRSILGPFHQSLVAIGSIHVVQD